MRRLRIDPSPSSVSQSLGAVFERSSVLFSATVCVLATPSPLRRLLRISATAERTTLSLITRTVTVAPLTMSTCGGRS
ncbi:hypothetical protein D3C73_1469360 [compost metagenome]